MLSPTTQSSTLPGIGRIRRFSRHGERYVGIDAGIDRVQVATFGLQRDQRKERSAAPEMAWLSQWEFEMPIDPQAPPPSNWVDLLVDQLVERLPRCVEGDRVPAVIALPLPWVHYQTTPEAEIGVCKTQCDAMFASSLFQSNAHLSCWPVVDGQQQWLVAATAEKAACQIAAAVASVGYRVQAILPHGIALLQAAPTLTSLNPSDVVLLEFSGGLVALSDEVGCGLCRNLPPCRIAMGEQPFVDELEPWLGEIATEVTATLRYASRLGRAADSESPVLVCGAAACIPGVDATLATMLGRPVATWRYAGRSRPVRRGDRIHSADCSGSREATSAVSLSLACCGILHDAVHKDR